MNPDRGIFVLVSLGAVFFTAFGLWAFLDPRSFFEELAKYEPYNAHFLHDIGAFQVGIGAALILGLWQRRDALFAALGGAGVGAAFHAAAHIRDHDLGGSSGDWLVHAVAAVLLLGGAVWQVSSGRGQEVSARR